MTETAARDAVDGIAHRLADPTQHVGREQPAQSLAAGAAGIALLHSERLASGRGDWPTVRSWLNTVLGSETLSTGDGCGLYFGAPACGFVADVTVRASPGVLSNALGQLDASVMELTHRRLDAAHARIDSGQFTTFGEYDLMRGLTGLGAYHLQRDHRDSVRAVLSYLVRLTWPHRDGLPGWWVDHAPTLEDRSPGFSHGHANFGMAHGIAGPLALLALAMRRDVTVEGHIEAIKRICSWLDVWQQPHPAGPTWPQWITCEQAHHGASSLGPGRPSWCYGTPGLARSQQLAAIVRSEHDRRRMAEVALLGSLTDQGQLARLTESGLCHGFAGLVQTTWRMAADASTGEIYEHVPSLIDALSHRGQPDSPEFLSGSAGVALTLQTTSSAVSDLGAWDTSLLLN